jgi:hypothetical protein
MPNVTKRRRAGKRPATPTPAPPVPNSIPPEAQGHSFGAKPETLLGAPTDIDYSPQLVTWTTEPFLFRDGQAKPFTMTVYEQRNDRPSRGGRELFKVTFSPLFDVESANRMLSLIRHAPELWRALRERARFLVLDDSESIEEFGRVAALLHDACWKVPPYDVPEFTEREDMAIEVNEQTLELSDERWRQAMNSTHVLVALGDRYTITRFFCAHCAKMEVIPSKIAAHLNTVHDITIDVPSGEVSRG